MTDTAELIARITDERAMWPMADEIRAAVAAQAQEIEQRERVIAGLNVQLTAEIAATQALAREIERLKHDIHAVRELRDATEAGREAAEARVREMEADTKQLGEQALVTLKVKEAATIERCAEVADEASSLQTEDEISAQLAKDIAAAIRALAKEPTA
jgi:hypothetical protein